MPRVQTGLEVLLETPELIGDRSWGLLSNQASVTADLRPARLALKEAVPGPLALLFAPEHGIDGVAQDMEAVADVRDRLTGCAVRSLYGAAAETLAPQPADLEGIEVVVVDLPDIGARYYTFAATMDWVMKACASAGSRCWCSIGRIPSVVWRVKAEWSRPVSKASCHSCRRRCVTA